MAVCHRYVIKEDDAIKILNDGFLKIFKDIHHYSPASVDVISSFKGCLRKIMVYTAINHLRKNYNDEIFTETDTVTFQVPAISKVALEWISYEDIIHVLQHLPTAYRIVFNLFVIDGFTHKEIAVQLGISIGTVKSNLSKAMKQLHEVLSGKGSNSKNH